MMSPVNAQNQIPGSFSAEPADDDTVTSDYSLPSNTGGVPTPSDGSVSDVLLIDFRIQPTDDNENNGENLVRGDGGKADGNAGANDSGNAGGNDEGTDGDNAGGNDGGNGLMNTSLSASFTTKRRIKSRRTKKRAQQQPPEPPVDVPIKQTVRAEASMVHFPISNPLFARTPTGILKGVEWERSLIPEDRFVYPVDLDSMEEVSLEKLKEWAGNDSDEEGDRKLLINQEKASKAYARDNCYLWQCAYCPNTYTDVKRLYEHVVGRKRYSRDRYLYCSCEVRCKQDGVEKGKIGKTQRPKKFPWGSITCEDSSKYKPVVDEVTGNVSMTFDVPDSLKPIWDKWMVNERPKESSGTPVEVCTPNAQLSY